MANVVEIVKVHAHWDNQDPSNEGWYAMTYARDESGELYERSDSMKVWFPVDLEGFERDQSDEVHEALVSAFPDAEIEVS